MQSLVKRSTLVLGGLLLVISFQNCSKIGNSGVAFSGPDSLELASEEQVAPQGADLPALPDQAAAGDLPKGPSSPDKSADEEVTDEEVAKIIALCKDSDQAAGFDESQSIRVVQESFDTIVNKVASVQAVQSRLVLRASDAQSKIDDAQIVQTQLVLCGFADIGSLRSTKGRIFMVGGSIQSAQLVQSTLVLIDANVKDHRGVKSSIKRYSSK